jgi:hypothetical protein
MLKINLIYSGEERSILGAYSVCLVWYRTMSSEYFFYFGRKKCRKGQYMVNKKGALKLSLPWRSRSQHDLAAKSYPVHNFVIWSRILQLFHRNDHHIETMCCAQHLGCFYTFNFVCDITMTLQEVYLPVSKTCSGSITRFNRLLFY